MRQIKAFMALLTVCSLMYACHHSGKSNVNSANAVNEEKRDSGTIGLSKGATEFMTDAANGGMTEVALGQLAQQKARTKRVKDFASMIVRDHKQANSRLKMIADAKNIVLPDSISNDSKDDLQKLSKLNGADFDEAYIKMMVDDHRKDVKEFRNESFKIKDGALSQWIFSTLGILRKHLDSAEHLKELPQDSL